MWLVRLIDRGRVNTRRMLAAKVGRGRMQEYSCDGRAKEGRKQKAEGQGRQKAERFLLSAFCFLPSKVWSGSVSRILFPSRGENHSSATRVAAVVEQPTRKLSMETGGSAASLFGLAPQGVCHAVAAHAGRGALLPHRFTLTSLSGSAVS